MVVELKLFGDVWNDGVDGVLREAPEQGEGPQRFSHCKILNAVKLRAVADQMLHLQHIQTKQRQVNLVKFIASTTKPIQLVYCSVQHSQTAYVFHLFANAAAVQDGVTRRDGALPG